MILDSSSMRNLSYFSQRHVLNPKSRELISRVISATRPRANYRGRSELVDSGFANLGSVLTGAQVSEVREYLSGGRLFEPYHREFGDFTIGSVPPGAHLGQYRRSLVIRAPHLLELANSPQVLEYASGLIGCKPTLSDMLVWWSFPGPKHAIDSQLWHRDRADWRMAKLFVYLTDVNDRSGPHVYAKNTAFLEDLTALKRFKSDDVKRLGAEIVEVVGCAGNALMTNPQGLHRASLPTEAPRLLFEATYSLCGLPESNYMPHGYERLRASEVPSGLDPWINRFWVVK